ncbi:MAG: hypothetical protein AAF571_01890 [Verrucomicrobiota bacterium]
MDIEDCEQDIRRIKKELRGGYRKDMSQDRRIQKLTQENDELKLYLAGLIHLLTSNGTITADDYAKVVEAIDAEDGTVDEKFGGTL